VSVSFFRFITSHAFNRRTDRHFAICSWLRPRCVQCSAVKNGVRNTIRNSSNIIGETLCQIRKKYFNTLLDDLNDWQKQLCQTYKMHKTVLFVTVLRFMLMHCVKTIMVQIYSASAIFNNVRWNFWMAQFFEWMKFSSLTIDRSGRRGTQRPVKITRNEADKWKKH